MTLHLHNGHRCQFQTVKLSPFYRPFSRWTCVNRYQNVSILVSIGAKGDGGGGKNWSYNTCKAPVKMSSLTNQHPVFYMPDAPPCRPTNSVKALKGNWCVESSQTLFRLILTSKLPIPLYPVDCQAWTIIILGTCLPDRHPQRWWNETVADSGLVQYWGGHYRHGYWEEV